MWICSQALTPPTIDAGTFSDYCVPLLAASDAYRTADYWKSFTNIAAPYTPTGTTFNVDGLKYEIISVNDLTCKLYAIDESLTEENLVIPETVVYKNRTFTPIEMESGLIVEESSIKSLSIPSCATKISAGVIWKTILEKLTVNAPIATNFVYASNIDELVITSTVNKFSTDLNSNIIGKIFIEDGETELTTFPFKCDDTKEAYLGRNVSENTFKDMTSLEKITISDEVASIGKSTFSGCTGLTFVDIGDSVTEIDNSAFNKCTAIRTVVSRNTTPPITNDIFCNDTYLDGVLYVPEASIEAYQAAAGWKNFWEIKPLSEYNGVDEIVVDKDIDIISVDNGVISVSGDRQVRIVSLNGAIVYSGLGEARVNVNPGIYVVIVGNTAHKVAVR
jgi:hypothetical protein